MQGKQRPPNPVGISGAGMALAGFGIEARGASVWMRAALGRV